MQVCPTPCLKVEFNFVKKNVDKYGLAEVLLLCSDSPLCGEDALVYIIYVCQYLVLVLITIETIHHPLFPRYFTTTSSVVRVGSTASTQRPLSCQWRASRRRCLLYRSSAPKSVDQIQHPLTSVCPISAQRGWSRDGGPGGQQPMSVRAARTKSSRQRSLVA